MNVGTLRALTLHCPPQGRVLVRLADGQLIDLIGAAVEVEPIAGEKITEWRTGLLLDAAPPKEASTP